MFRMHCSSLFRSLGVAVLCSLVFVTGAAQAAEVRWKKQNFVYIAKGKNIRDFLREFGVSQGLTVVVAPAVEGTVNGKFDLLPASLMALMSANFGFVWYFDGNVLNVYPASVMRSEVVRLSNSTTDQFRSSLERLDVLDSRYPIVYDVRQGTALISGPGPYVDRVIQVARSMGQAPGEGAAVRVVTLKYAWAKDVTVSQGGQERVIPGVASVMTQLHGSGGGGGGSGPVSLPAAASSRSTLDKLRGMGLAINGGSSSARDRTPETDTDPTNTTRAVSEAGSPRFTADGRLNAVLIRDLPEHLDALEATVRALDTRPGLVEIEVRIIEVNADEAESLGVDWRLRGSRLDVQVGQSGGQSLGFGSALSGGVPGAGPLAGSSAPLGGGVLTTVLGDAGRFLIARVNLLAQQGKANLLSSPKVMTLDNVEAVMEDLSTFFVRVQGNLDVDLFNVSAGTSLRVTPLIVEDGNNQQQVKLAIRIEDGAVTAQSVDGVPIVRRSVISTQSLIKDGQALLIAGYARESQSDTKAGVPGLSEVPVAGWLFKNTEKRKTRVERFFLLTPRVVLP